MDPSPEKFGHAVTQRLHRIVAVRAINGASGARHFRSRERPSIHFTAGTSTGGTQALTVLHRNASTPSGPSAPPGHTLTQRPQSLQAGAPVLSEERSACRSKTPGHDSAQQQPRPEPGREENGIPSDRTEPPGCRDLLQPDYTLYFPISNSDRQV